MSPQHTQPGERTFSWRPLIAATVALAVVLSVIVVFADMVWNPPSRTTNHADAVVVLAYGQDRLRTGRELVEEGVADNLVISVSEGVQRRIDDGRLAVLTPEEVAEGLGEEGPWIEECGEQYAGYRTECIRPQPNTTEGEAIAVAGLVREYDWDTLVIVTERSHMRRGLTTFEACTPAEIYTSTSDISGPWYRNVRRTVHEFGALWRDLLFRSC